HGGGTGHSGVLHYARGQGASTFEAGLLVQHLFGQRLYRCLSHSQAVSRAAHASRLAGWPKPCVCAKRCGGRWKTPAKCGASGLKDEISAKRFYYAPTIWANVKNWTC